MPGTRVFSRDKVRQVDAEAVETYGIPSIVLMENASRGLADRALRMLDAAGRRDRGHVLVVCGGGNNAGDGLAAARHLHNAGIRVTSVLLRPTDGYKGDAGTNLRIDQAMGLPLLGGHEDPVGTLDGAGEADLIVDAVLGTGLTSAVRSPMDEVIRWVNERPAPVLAVDIPSGLDCDRGVPLGVAVEAAATVTFVGTKRGFLVEGADRYVGEIVIGDIGIPRELAEALGEMV